MALPPRGFAIRSPGDGQYGDSHVLAKRSAGSTSHSQPTVRQAQHSSTSTPHALLQLQPPLQLDTKSLVRLPMAGITVDPDDAKPERTRSTREPPRKTLRQ